MVPSCTGMRQAIPEVLFMFELQKVNAASELLVAAAKNYCLTIQETLSSLASVHQNDRNSLSEVSETQSLQLQMVVDRMSKMMETLSNVLQKMADTGDSVTQNLK